MITRKWPKNQLILIISLLITFFPSHSQAISFTFNGFRSSANNLTLDGIAGVTPTGLLELTNYTRQKTGHAFYPTPVSLKPTKQSAAVSFSTTFVFAIVSQYPTVGGQGLAFVVAPTRGLPGALPSSYLGLFNVSNNGNATNHVVAVELDTIYSSEFGDINDNHDYMPNGSLDKYLYDQPTVTLNWSQRFRVIKGVASGFNYLHEEWEQVVIHRDVKASNVLLDGELNGRLGDFGLARLYDHGTDPQTTHVVGTFGYLAPEHTRTGKATTSTDVFAFGAFLLEVACGRRPVETRGPNQDVILVDWVVSHYFRGEILEAKDPHLGSDYSAEEVELVLKLVLLCSNLDAKSRPSMSQVVQFLQKDVPLPQLTPALQLGASGLSSVNHEGFDDYALSYPSGLSYSTNSVGGRGFKRSASSSSVAELLLSGGR